MDKVRAPRNQMAKTMPPRDPLMIYKSQDDKPDDADQASQTSHEVKAGLSWLRKRFPGIQSRINADEDPDEALLVIKQAFSATHVKLFRVERDDITTADRVVAI